MRIMGLLNRVLLDVFVVAVAVVKCHAFVTSTQRSSAKTTIRTKKWSRSPSQPSSPLLMALTPIGPFCPFRSSAAEAVAPKLEGLNQVAPEFASEMAKVQMDIQLGKEPDKESLFRVADGMEDAVSRWESLLVRLKMSGDFQTREYAKMVEAHLISSGVTPKGVASMMRWQGACLRSMALNAPPPMPPADLNLQTLLNSASVNNKPPPSITKMSAAEKITKDPFDESALKTEVIRIEYGELCRDHKNLIEMGTHYSAFDPSEKIAFIEAIERIEERWDVCFTRFSLMGELNSMFSQQCQAFLMSMNLNNELEYRSLLKKSHDMMRQDAEEERNILKF